MDSFFYHSCVFQTGYKQPSQPTLFLPGLKAIDCLISAEGSLEIFRGPVSWSKKNMKIKRVFKHLYRIPHF